MVIYEVYNQIFPNQPKNYNLIQKENKPIATKPSPILLYPAQITL